MVCAYCKESFVKINDMESHWLSVGCPSRRSAWEKFMEARRRGSSGRRILNEAYPNLWKSDPMDEETKEKLREIQERRKAQGIKMPKKRARR